LESGEKVCIYDLLHGLMLPSGNDAANTLAYVFGSYIWYSDNYFKGSLRFNKDPAESRKILLSGVHEDIAMKNFINEMNRFSSKLSLHCTHYSNPHGLPNRANYSSAADVCRATMFALKDPLFKEIVNK
jgi:D-alanyl-D-alanine carboxypeptidase